MGGSNHKATRVDAPQDHTLGKKRCQLIVGIVAVCAALSVSGIAFATGSGGSSVSWEAVEKEQPPVPIEQTEAPETEGETALPAAGDAVADEPAAVEPVADPAAADAPVATDAIAPSVASKDGDGPADPRPDSDPTDVAPVEDPVSADPEPAEPQEAEPAPALATVRLSVEPADRATVSCGGVTYRSGDSLEAEAPTTFALTVAPVEGFEVESVTVIRTAAPSEGAQGEAPVAAPGAGEAQVLEADAAGAYVVDADAEAAIYQVSVTLRDGRINSYENLKAALEQGGSVVLEADVVAEGPLTVAADATLDLAGHTLSLPADKADAVGGGALITVQADATFSLVDSAATPLKSQCRAEELGVQASTAGKLASYDAGARELTYYVTTTKTNRSAGTTSETRHEEHLSLAGSGAIEASGINALVAVEDGAAFSMDGGRLTNAGGAHAIKAGNATVTLGGNAAIAGSGNASATGEDANGAGIYQAGGTLTVGGSAVIAGNEAASSGGGIYLAAGSAVIGGDAVIAGNVASRLEGQEDGGVEHLDTYNGGGIYVGSTASLAVGGDVVIAGNRAARDGGGIYVAPQRRGEVLTPSNRLSVTGGTVTNNHSDARKSPTAFAVSGGGGIFSMGDTVIESAVITSNRAADAGGGLCMPGESRYQMPLLAMVGTVVAANWSEASEGGGMFCHTAGAGTADQAKGRLSYVTTGTYITNNHTNTKFDYGGGGLFVPVDGFLNVVYPVVSGNEARGLGGGVAACSNSTVITQDAAIFDNKALGENHTTNPNEYGDRWAMLDAGKGPGKVGNDPGDRTWSMKDTAIPGMNNADAYDTYADGRMLTYLAQPSEDGTVEPLNADDFFSAHRATVYGRMLGSHEVDCPEGCTEDHRSDYGWTGWMSASPSQDEVLVEYRGWKKGATLTLPDGERVEAFSAGARANNLGWYLWVKKDDFTEDTAENLARSFDGASIDYTSPSASFKTALTGFYASGQEGDPNLICLDFKRYADGGYLENADGTSANDRLHRTVDDTDLAPRELEAATRTEPLAYYRVYHIDEGQFPEGDGFAHANRIMALKANPDTAAKVSARNAACVFVTGNSSNTNGGGIGCNGFIHIGRPDPSVPDEPTDKEDPTHFGSFRIAKTIKDFPTDEDGVISAGRATVVFHVVGYADAGSVDGGGVHNVIYDAYHALEFDANETQEIVLGRFPVGSYFTVTEVSYSGANFEIADGEGATRSVTVTANDDTAEDAVIPVVNFVNAYREDGHHSTGVVNTYTKQDGAYTVIQKWSKTQVVVAAPEGEGSAEDPQTPADES